jgi:hypothetical protein
MRLHIGSWPPRQTRWHKCDASWNSHRDIHATLQTTRHFDWHRPATFRLKIQWQTMWGIASKQRFPILPKEDAKHWIGPWQSSMHVIHYEFLNEWLTRSNNTQTKTSWMSHKDETLVDQTRHDTTRLTYIPSPIPQYAIPRQSMSNPRHDERNLLDPLNKK